MLKRVTWMVALASLVVAPAVFAQEHRGEVGVLLGWSFEDGVDGQQIKALNGQLYDRIDPKDAFKWGLTGGVLVGDNAEVGFMWTQVPTKLEASGTTTTEIGDMTINNYHAYFGYNFGDADAMIRPYFMGGLGATSFGAVNYTRLNNQAATIGGTTKFSSTWGLGVKAYPNPKVGIKVGVQFTPVYIKSDSAGWWCDPWWGCYVVGNAKYANQWDLLGGVLFRF